MASRRWISPAAAATKRDLLDPVMTSRACNKPLATVGTLDVSVPSLLEGDLTGREPSSYPGTDDESPSERLMLSEFGVALRYPRHHRLLGSIRDLALLECDGGRLHAEGASLILQARNVAPSSTPFALARLRRGRTRRGAFQIETRADLNRIT